MTGSHTKKYFKLLAALPEQIRIRAERSFNMWLEHPSYPGLHFKKVSPNEPIWSIRITDNYRALGFRNGDDVSWFWIGTHDDYQKMLSRL